MRCYVFASRQQFNEYSGQFDVVYEVLEFADKRYLRDFVRGNNTAMLSNDDGYLKILKMIEGQSLSVKEFL